MSKRFDNKKLLILLAGLVAILFLTTIIRIPKENATLRDKIVEFDTSDVAGIILYPKLSMDKPVEFSRTNGKWNVKQGTVVSATQEGVVKNMLSEVINLKPQSLASVEKSKWKDFELTDSLATRVKFLDKGGKILGDLLVGKLTYRQLSDQNGGYGGNNIQGTSFLRLYNEKEVYSVDGFIAFYFSGKFDDWRDKTFIRFNQNDVTNIAFTYPSDSSFKLTRKELLWFVDNQATDSANTENYLSLLSSLNGQDFKDGFKPDLNPSYQLQIEGNNLLGFYVKCFEQPGSGEYILNSSLNPDVYFTSKRNGIFETLFKPRSYFLKRTDKK
jgi:hypothetical protein